MIASPFSVQLDPRVDQLVKDVTHQVHEDHDEGEENGRTHDHRVITVRNTVDELGTKSADGEDLFDNQRAGQDGRGQGTDVGDDRNEAVAQRVYENDLPVGNALRPCRADVVLSEDVQHTRLRQTGDVRHGGQRQRQNGQHVAWVVGTPDRHPLELDAEDEQQKRRHDETWHSGKERYEEDDDTVRPLVTVQRRDGAEDDAEDERDQNGK